MNALHLRVVLVVVAMGSAALAPAGCSADAVVLGDLDAASPADGGDAAAAEVGVFDAEATSSPDASADVAAPDDTAAAAPEPVTPEEAAALEAALQRGLAASGARNALAGVRLVDRASGAGETRWLAAAGPDHLATNATFRVGSVTKLVVAAVVLRLVDQGVVGLDDTIAPWFPDLRNAEGITVRQLLQHTSGLFDYLRNPDFQRAFLAKPKRIWTLAGLSAYFDGPASFPPGGGFAYSNTNYLVLAGIVEAATQRTIGSLLHSEVLDPLALAATTYPPDDPPAPAAPPMAPGYSAFFGDGPEPVPVQDVYSPTVAGAAGALVSNVPDLLTLLAGLEARVPVALRGPWRTTVNSHIGYGYGLGLMVFDLGTATVEGHLGTIWGYQTVALISQDARFAVVLMLDGDDVDVIGALVPLLDVLAPR